jgi:hypothetical protein
MFSFLRRRSAVRATRRPATCRFTRQLMVERLEDRCLPSGILNGGFEEPVLPGGAAQLFSPGAMIGAWTVVGDAGTNVYLLQTTYSEPWNNVSQFNAQEGLNSVDLSGDGNKGPSAGVEQTVPTIAGHQYTLSFFVGRATPNGGPAGVYAAPATDDLSIDGGPRISFTNSDITEGMINWKQFSYTFTANGDSTAIAFFNGTPLGTNEAGLDNVTLVDEGLATTTTVTSSANPSMAGQPVTFTATVSALGGGNSFSTAGNKGSLGGGPSPGGTGFTAGAPSGTVLFLDGSTPLDTEPLSGGTAAFTTSALSVGSHDITVVYSGDSLFAPSTSAVLTQTVNEVGSTFEWIADHDGSWTDPANWFRMSGSGSMPNGMCDVAEFRNTITAARIITIPNGVKITLGAIHFDSPYPYTIAAAGSGALRIASCTGPGSIDVEQGAGATAPAIVAPIELSSSLVVSGPGDVSLGAMCGPGGLAIASASTVTMMDPSCYSGGTQILDGTLAAGGENVMSKASAVSIAPAARLWLKGFSQEVASLAGEGAVDLGQNPASTLTVGGDDSDSTFAGPISGKGGVTKVGQGKFISKGTHSYSGPTQVQEGIWQEDGANVNSTFALFPKAKMKGVGHAGHVEAVGAEIAPGDSPGILTLDGLTADAATTLSFEIDGTTPGFEYSKLDVTGPIDLGSAILDVSLGFAPGLGTTFDLIENEGGAPIAGTFAGLPEGALFAINGTPFVITYHGGASGNDVVLRRIGATSTQLASSLNPSVFGQNVTFTATVGVSAPDTGTPTGMIQFKDGDTIIDTETLSAGSAAFTTSTLSVGDHSISAVYVGDGIFSASVSPTLTQTVNPQPSSLSGLVFEDFNDDGQVDFGERGIAGVSITLDGTDDLGHRVSLTQVSDADGAFRFLDLRPGNYTLTETQPVGYLQGKDSVGSAGGSLVATDQFFVQLSQGVNGLNYNFGERPPAGGAVQPGQTAGIGFWHNKNGQALIKALNGGGASTQLGDWLAATLPSMFGQYAGSNNLAGKSNASIAALFQQDFLQTGQKLDAQVLATALSVYVTNATLDSTKVAAQYGFTVSGDGVGTATVNVGSNGAAFGVANNSTLTVLDLLLASDAQAVGGVLYNGNTPNRNEANIIYSAVNQAGDIG